MKRTSSAGMAALVEDLQLRQQNTIQQGDRARSSPGGTPANFVGQDSLVRRDGMRFAGTHLIVDFWQAFNLSDAEVIETVLRRAADEAGATVLSLDLHCFSPNGGITGVAVLAESHISIHTWPEHAYAAVDIFMCGKAEPHKAIAIMRDTFEPKLLTVTEHRRGVML